MARAERLGVDLARAELAAPEIARVRLEVAGRRAR